MTELDDLLDLEQEKKLIELSKTEKKVINYLLNLKGERLFIEKMAKDTGLAKQTIYTKLENLQKRKVISSSWKLNPFALGFKIVESEVKISKSKEKEIIKKLAEHPAISSIRKCFQNNLLIDFIVRDIGDYKEIEKHLKKGGVEFLDSKIITEKIYEP